MKKVLFVVALVAVGVAIFVAVKPSGQSTGAANKTTSQAGANDAQGKSVTLTSPKAAQQPLTGFAASEVIAALRAALASPDRVGYDAAFQALIDYINAHPENIEEFNGFMRSESDEQVLRHFTFALAASEVGLLENPEIIKTVTELAKTSTAFDQRQHIMLHLMSKFPQVGDDVLNTALDVARQDPNPQVKTSGMVVLADWIQAHPDRTSEMLDHIKSIFDSAADDEVRAFGYQVLALHKESLTPEIHAQLSQLLRSEEDSFHGNLIAMALFAAPDGVRSDALGFLETAYANEKDMETRRNRLLQLIMVSRGGRTDLLKQLAGDNSLLARDAKRYLELLSANEQPDPQVLLLAKGEMDTDHNASCAGNHQNH